MRAARNLLIAYTLRLILLLRHIGMVYLVPLVAWPFGYLRSPRQVVSAWPEGAVTLGARVAVVCHYDAAGRVRPDLFNHLSALREAGICVVLVSNSFTLEAEAAAHLRPICAAILVRRNVGYDFCAWRDALEHLGLPRADTEEVLLVNDSVYGPLSDLTPVLARIEQTGADVVALTDSRQRGWHLQSYFVCFKRAALHSAAWRRFWASVRPVPSKQWVINHCEVGLTRRLRDEGLTCEALWPETDLLRHLGSGRQADRVRERLGRGQLLNPTHDLWRVLLESDFPFIKRELLRQNPSRVPDVADWQSVAKNRGASNIEPIESDLHAV